MLVLYHFNIMILYLEVLVHMFLVMPTCIAFITCYVFIKRIILISLLEYQNTWRGSQQVYIGPRTLADQLKHCFDIQVHRTTKLENLSEDNFEIFSAPIIVLSRIRVKEWNFFSVNINTVSTKTTKQKHNNKNPLSIGNAVTPASLFVRVARHELNHPRKKSPNNGSFAQHTYLQLKDSLLQKPALP